ncbi:MAG TPA: chromate transporter [Anaerolineales bacterium]
MDKILLLFWTFLKVNLLSTSGPASVGLLYKEAVGHFLTEQQYIQAVGFSTLLPGSDALQLAMFVGFTTAGIPGGIVSLLGAILPPTVLMFGVVSVLHRIRRESWVGSFVEGLTPAVAVLMLFVAWKVFKGGNGGLDWQSLLIGGSSLVALLLEVPAPVVIFLAGLAGVFIFR